MYINSKFPVSCKVWRLWGLTLNNSLTNFILLQTLNILGYFSFELKNLLSRPTMVTFPNKLPAAAPLPFIPPSSLYTFFISTGLKCSQPLRFKQSIWTSDFILKYTYCTTKPSLVFCLLVTLQKLVLAHWFFSKSMSSHGSMV